MNQELFKEKYKKFNESNETILMSINTVLKLEKFANKNIEDTTIEDIKLYSKYLVDQNMNTYNNYIHIARYYYYIDYKEHYIHMTKYFNTHGVLENIINRITLFETKEKKDAIMKEVKLPPFGTDSSDLPRETEKFMNILNKHLDQESCDKILAGNNHDIPKESFLKEREHYQESSSLEDYLAERHNRKVQDLQDHLDITRFGSNKS